MSVVLCKELITQNGKKIAIATLNTPRSLNALNLEMMTFLKAKLTTWQNDDEIVMVILQGAGEKAFCAGGDVVSLYHDLDNLRMEAINESKPAVLTEQVIGDHLAYEFFVKEYSLDQFIHEYAKPIMVWGDGYVMGGGIGLFAGASHRVVTERTLLAMPEITIGLYPDVGASWFLNKMAENYGLFLGLTGAMFNAADAKYVDFADNIIASHRFDELINELLSASWQNEQDNYQLLTQILGAFSQQEILGVESNLKKHAHQIAELTDYDNGTDVYQAIVNFQTDDEWLQSAQNKLRNGSPLSALIIYQQQLTSKNLNLSECFASELNLSLRCCQYPEFSEGVRALLVDKDKMPRWQYQNITDIPKELVDWFFTPFNKHK